MRRLAPLALALAAGLARPDVLVGQQRSESTQGCPVTDTCTAPGRTDEVAIVMLGDSGFGEGGASEWGSHAQAAVARRIGGLCPRPHLVFLLGDNIYWKGSSDLFGPRFDQMYRELIDPERRRVHAALGNHDVKGCELSPLPAFGPGRTCLDALRRTLSHEDPPEGPGPEDTTSWLSPEVAGRARALPPEACPSAFEMAYEQDQRSGGECFAGAALRHATFGYATFGGESLRYYTVDWKPAEGSAQPPVRVVVADSNTLDVGHRSPGGAPEPPARRDGLQPLWIENQLRTAPADAWRIVALHHPPFTPRGCVFRLLGRCIGGHGDQERLQVQLAPAFGANPATGAFAAWRPDMVFGAHNHLYARTTALDSRGFPTLEPGGVRYFVSGGGGAPLYRVQPPHRRYASAGSFHHFVSLRLRGDVAFFWAVDTKGRVRDSGCFRKGESTDRCIASGSYQDDAPVCGEPRPLTGCAPPEGDGSARR